MVLPFTGQLRVTAWPLRTLSIEQTKTTLVGKRRKETDRQFTAVSIDTTDISKCLEAYGLRKGKFSRHVLNGELGNWHTLAQSVGLTGRLCSEAAADFLEQRPLPPTGDGRSAAKPCMRPPCGGPPHLASSS